MIEDITIDYSSGDNSLKSNLGNSAAGSAISGSGAFFLEFVLLGYLWLNIMYPYTGCLDS